MFAGTDILKTTMATTDACFTFGIIILIIFLCWPNMSLISVLIVCLAKIERPFGIVSCDRWSISFSHMQFESVCDKTISVDI